MTYPHETVKHELAGHWLTSKVDVEQHKAVADLCGITAIPAAFAVDPDGVVLGTVLGFVEPADFGAQLEQLRKDG